MKVLSLVVIINIGFGFTGINNIVKPNIRTKQIATIGPGCNSYNMLSKMYNNGVDIFRINLSHEDHLSLVEKVDMLNHMKKVSNTRLKILVDLQGPKHRIGKVNENILLREGSELRLDKDVNMGNENRVYLGHDDIYENIKNEDKILIDDGLIELEVKGKGEDFIDTEVLKGGILKSNKGVNLPNCKLNNAILTEKDMVDICFINNLDIDYVALSFVESKSDLLNLKKVLKCDVKIIAKIERPLGVENIEEICDECDGIMIARGDLGVEVGLEKVPLIQKKCIKIGRKKDKEVIVATQMMESMINNPIPTRAEVSDVANAVLDGATGLLLSGETSVGKNPIDCIKIQRKIIKEIEDIM
tara:strand:- start:1841 stop:2914 length:1074 start_codon:yes stop_codon:yes gene_type:complete